MKDIHTNTWPEYFAEKDIRPCATCNVQRENDVLRERAVGWKQRADRNEWRATHWTIWQAAVSPWANLLFAIRRCVEESVPCSVLLGALALLSIYGATVLTVDTIAAIQEAAK